MKEFLAAQRIKIATIILLLSILIFGSTAQTFAHGDEDHGNEKPKTTASDKGTILHTARLGDFELMLKHPLLTPDTATSARLFITRFETNESIDKAIPAIEIESGNGSITQGTVEKNEAGGSYTVKISALPQGDYTVRAKLTYDGETDTATFSGVRVAPAPIADSESGMSWARTVLIGIVFALVLALFGGLIYFIWRFAEGEPLSKETVSA